MMSPWPCHCRFPWLWPLSRVAARESAASAHSGTSRCAALTVDVVVVDCDFTVNEAFSTVRAHFLPLSHCYCNILPLFHFCTRISTYSSVLSKYICKSHHKQRFHSSFTGSSSIRIFFIISSLFSVRVGSKWTKCSHNLTCMSLVRGLCDSSTLSSPQQLHSFFNCLHSHLLSLHSFSFTGSGVLCVCVHVVKWCASATKWKLYLQRHWFTWTCLPSFASFSTSIEWVVGKLAAALAVTSTSLQLTTTAQKERERVSAREDNNAHIITRLILNLIHPYMNTVSSGQTVLANFLLHLLIMSLWFFWYFPHFILAQLTSFSIFDLLYLFYSIISCLLPSSLSFNRSSDRPYFDFNILNFSHHFFSTHICVSSASPHFYFTLFLNVKIQLKIR